MIKTIFYMLWTLFCHIHMRLSILHLCTCTEMHFTYIFCIDCIHNHTACFYWSAGKFGTISCLLCSCKLTDDVSIDLFLLTWKDMDGSLTSKFDSWWKCYSCATKLVRSSRNTCNTGLQVHPILFLLRTSPRNGALSTTSKGGWWKKAHHLISAATKLFLLGCELAFLLLSPSIIRHMPAITAC